MQNETKVIDLKEVVGIYGISNKGAVLVHRVDYSDDRVLASINGENPEWCDFTEEYWEGTGQPELGFCLGSFFVPFCEVMRFHG